MRGSEADLVGRLGSEEKGWIRGSGEGVSESEGL